MFSTKEVAAMKRSKHEKKKSNHKTEKKRGQRSGVRILRTIGALVIIVCMLVGFVPVSGAAPKTEAEYVQGTGYETAQSKDRTEKTDATDGEKASERVSASEKQQESASASTAEKQENSGAASSAGNQQSSESASSEEKQEKSESAKETEQKQGTETLPSGEKQSGSDMKSDSQMEAEDKSIEKNSVSALPRKLQANGWVQVWFDGTDGMGTGEDGQDTRQSLYTGATNVRRNVAQGSTITLPTTAGSNSKYTLKGWYDIVNGKYYQPGATVRINDNTVFYAEWVLKNYNLGPSAAVVANQPDISSFVKTDVFDYNEIFNIKHGAVLDGSLFPNGNRMHQSSGWPRRWISETWKDSGDLSKGSDFLFTNWFYHKAYPPQWLGFPQDAKHYRNTYAGDSLTKGIVNKRSDALMTDLFGTSDAPGKVSLGEGNWLYQYDNNKNSEHYGYYYYNSDNNAADYNREKGRFYVYQNSQKIVGDNGLDDGQSHTSFMPFEAGTGDIKKGTGQTNFWFGMHSTIDFYLPDDSGSGGNKALGNHDMQFEFSGDDDVWVFVDDQLVLDLGGIHGTRKGSINFSTGKVTVSGDDGSMTQMPAIQAGDHKLHFYYLERGSSWSNASIYFNIAPRYGLTIAKKDKDTQAKLRDAQFSFYIDKNCTIPARLWKSEKNSQADAASNTFTSDENGILSCYGLRPGVIYYIKETGAPAGYPSVADKTFVLDLDKDGKVTLTNDGDGLAELEDGGGTDRRILLNISNKKPKGTSIKAVKKWRKKDGGALTEDLPKGVTVRLYRKAYDAGAVEPDDPGDETEYTVKVLTQYFGSDTHGSNTDNAPIRTGDLTESIKVKNGGQVKLTLNAHPDSDFGTAIYAVTANGNTISADAGSATKYTSRNMQIAGNWGSYPPQNGTYTIGPVTKDTTVVITLIGYLNYTQTGNTGSVKQTLDISSKVSEGSGSGSSGSGQGSGSQQTVIPAEKPKDAERAKYSDGSTVEDFVLSPANGWGENWDGWKNLPTQDQAGKHYYYYVSEETELPGFTASYSGNAATDGTVTIKNVRREVDIPVAKVWSDGSDQHTVDSVEVHLLADGNDMGKTLVLNQSNGWKAAFAGLPEIGSDGKAITYTVQETEKKGYTASVTGSPAAGFTITNTRMVSLAFQKVDATGGRELKNAEFSLFRDHQAAQAVSAYTNEAMAGDATTAFVSGSDGMVHIYGLTAGNYYLKETRAPGGYTRIGTLIKITLDQTGNISSASEVSVDKEGKETIVSGNTYVDFNRDTQSLKIKNYPVSKLPATGGKGIFLSILIGVCGLGTAVFLLLTNKRKCRN